jgi:hypothetical protein
MDVDSGDLAQRYPCLMVFVDGKAAATMGSGLRMLFVAACDGKTVVAYNSLGQQICAPRSCFQVHGVKSAKGVALRFEIDEGNGHLLACPDESKPNEWVDLFPWAVFEKASEVKVRAAKRGEQPAEPEFEDEDDWSDEDL